MTHSSCAKTKIAAAALLFVGLMQMSGDILRLPLLKGIGATMCASPAPKVFSAVRGLETYSTRFYLEWTDTRGHRHSLLITPEIYSKLAGPYNRRNVYGAVLAYGPVLAVDPRSQAMLNSVSAHALCGKTSLLSELGIDQASVAGRLRVRYEPLPGTDIGTLPTVLEAPCR